MKHLKLFEASNKKEILIDSASDIQIQTCAKHEG